MMKQCVMFTVGAVHSRYHGSGCAGADPKPVARQTICESYIMPIQECNKR